MSYNPRGYEEDSLYFAGANNEVFQGKPGTGVGNEGDEQWCWVDGEGLFLAKKYNGEWRFFTSSTELLEAGVVSNDSTSSGGGSGSTVAQTGQFSNLTVTNSASLQNSTGISGTLSVTATSLTAFPHTDNLKLTNSELDTKQDIQIESAPRFNNLGLGIAASGEAGNIELTSVLGVNAATFINSALKVGKINYTNTAGTSLTDGLGLESLTQFEATQLKNIDSSSISSTQWGYVGGMDQDVASGSDVVFAKATLTDSGKTWSFDPIGDAGSNANLTTGGLQITTSNTADSPIIIGGSSYDDHTIRNYAYTSGMFTGDGWSIYEDNNLHNMEIDNLSVRGTLSVYELLIQQIRATNGSVFITSAAKITTEGNGVKLGNANIWILTFETDEDNDKPHPFASNDLILARRCDISGDTTNIVSEVRFKVSNANGGTASQLHAYLESSSITLPTTAQEETALLNGFDFVRIGNTTDANRQGGIYLTSDDTLAPFIDIFDEVSSWQEWDGITNIFGLADGSFDLATIGEYDSNGGESLFTGSSWSHITYGDAKVNIVSNGGVSNQKYCKLDRNNSNAAYILQNITFPYVASGNYKVTIEWYGKQDPISAYEPRICIRDIFPGSADIGFDAGGILQENDGLFIDWEDITSPENQRSANTVWHKYQWKLTVPSTMFSGTADKVMELCFATSNAGDMTTWVDDVSISMEGKVKTRIGRLEGVGKTGYGLWGENVYLKGRIEAEEGYIGNEFAGWRIDSTGITNEGTQSYISSGQTTVGLDGGGAYLDGEGDLSLGDSSSAGLKWDQSLNTLTVRGNVHVGTGGSVDSSTLPSFGQNLKIAAGGRNPQLANVGVFKADANGEILSQVGGQPSTNSSYTGTLMVFDSATNLLDTSYNSTGVKHTTNATTLSDDINNLDNGTLVGVAIHYSAYYWLNDDSPDKSTALISSLKNCGGSSHSMDSTFYPCAYVLLGVKQSTSNTKGTELVSLAGEASVYPNYVSITANFKDNIIDILDWEGSLTDFDAESPKSYKFSNASGFKFFRKNFSYNSWFAMISFPMPYVKAEDTGNLELFFTSKNLSDEGVGEVRLYLNGTHVSAISGLDLQDADGTTEFIHQFHNIPSNLFKVDPGEVNVFELRSLFNGTTTDTQYIYDFELRDSTTGAVYSSGANVSPEGNLVANAGFENITGTNVLPNWTLENRGSGTGYLADTTDKMTGTQSLKHISGASPTYQSYIYQAFTFKTNTFYTLRFNFKWEDNWTGSTSSSGVLGDLPKFSIIALDIDGAGTDASFDINTSTGVVTWYNAKKWNPFSLIGSISNSATNSWQTFEVQFKIPTNAPVGASNTAITNPTDFQVWLYTGEQANQTVWFDAVQLFEHENIDMSVSAEETGLYVTGDRLGFYNGSGGLYGWSSLIKNDGSFFFGSPYEQANLLSPGSGGPYIRFSGDTLEVNAKMVAGEIVSENLTATTGTYINLSDGSMTTQGTNTDSGLVLDSSGNLELNGATLDGGTITSQLMLANYAEGDVDFVTTATNIGSSAYQQVSVNGVRRLLCNRVCDSAELDFNTSSYSNQSKNLEIWRYDDQNLTNGDAAPYVSALNRVAGTEASTKLLGMAPGFPFMNFQFFTKEGDAENKEMWKMKFVLEYTSYFLIFRLGARIDKVGDDGGEVVFGMHTCNETQYNAASGTGLPSHSPWSTGGSTTYNLLYHSGGVNADEDDYSDMQMEQIDIGNFTITAVSEVRHLQDGTTNIINAGVDFYLSGGGVLGINEGTMKIECNRESAGSHLIDANIYFPAGMFRVYN